MLEQNSSCFSVDDLRRFNDGSLRADAAEKLAEHLEYCDQCCHQLGQLDSQILVPIAKQELFAFQREPEFIQLERRLSEVSNQISIRSKASNDAALADLEGLREYRVMGEIGRGGMGAVYQAHHAKLDRFVALKVLPISPVSEPGALARFEREMRAVATLDHPNIVRALDAGEIGDTHFLVMEFVDGLDVSRLVRLLGRLPIADACEIVRQAANGLEEAHDHGMVHRDVKPSNLMLSQPKRRKPPIVKILDLGLAVFSSAHRAEPQALTLTGQAMGTLDYMAPEQGGDSKSVDIRADIYSLGATLYKLLTGEPVYHGEAHRSPVQKIMALATKPVRAITDLRPEVPAGLAAAIHRMLEKDPAARFATPSEVAEALKQFCEGHDLSVLLESGRKAAMEAASAEPADDDQISRTQRTARTALANRSTVKAKGHAEETQEIALPPPAPRWSIPRSLGGPLVALAILGLIAIISAGIVFFIQTPNGTLRIEINDPGIAVRVKGSDVILKNVGAEDIVLKAGEHSLLVTRGDFEFETKQFELSKDEVTTVSVRYVKGKIEVVEGGRVFDERAHEQKPPVPDQLAIAPFDASAAKSLQAEWAKRLGLPIEYTNSMGMTFALIPPGEFDMGSTNELIEQEVARYRKPQIPFVRSEGPRHRVRISQPFYLGKYELTQAQFEKVTGKNPSHFAASGKGSEDVPEWDAKLYPADSIWWTDAFDFCIRLNEIEEMDPILDRNGEQATIRAGTGYRLPTEAEWEFACRAGTTSRFWSGDSEANLREIAWFEHANEPVTTHPVGLLKPNPFGLHDVHGNVAEWVHDSWDADYYQQLKESGLAVDPHGPDSPTGTKTARGGFYRYPAHVARSARRIVTYSDIKTSPGAYPVYMGLRVALSISDVERLSKASTPEASSIPPNPIAAKPAQSPSPANAPFSGEEAAKHQEAWAAFLELPTEYSNPLGMRFRLIPPGEFDRGVSKEFAEQLIAEGMRPDELAASMPRHRVRLTQPFYLGVHEVTQGQYLELVPQIEAKQFVDAKDSPICNLGFEQIASFCNKLSAVQNLTPRYVDGGSQQNALGYRLPSEAEWEFACLAGKENLLTFDGDYKAYARIDYNSAVPGTVYEVPAPVGTLLPNAFGLYDMRGNVCESCEDFFAADYFHQLVETTAVNPAGPVSGDLRVYRGGHFSGNVWENVMRRGGAGQGFRVALPIGALQRLRVDSDPTER